MSNKMIYIIVGSTILVGGLVYWLFFSKSAPGRAKQYPKITSGWSKEKYNWFKENIIDGYALWAKNNPWKGLEMKAAYRSLIGDPGDKSEDVLKSELQSRFSTIEKAIAEAKKKQDWDKILEEAAQENAEWKWKTGGFGNEWFTKSGSPKRYNKWLSYANKNNLSVEGHPAK